MRLTYNGLTLATLETGKNAGAVNNSTAYEEVTIDSAARLRRARRPAACASISFHARGSNAWKGTWFSSYTDEHLQGSNYTQELKDRGLRTPNEIKKNWDVNPGIGGPIIRDKMWFYGTIRDNGWQEFVAGMFVNSNAGNANAWTFAPDTAQPAASRNGWQDLTVRLTWQATPRNKMAVSLNQQKGWTYTGGSATAAPESVTESKYDPKRNIFGDWTVPATNRLLFEAVGTYGFEHLRPGRYVPAAPDGGHRAVVRPDLPRRAGPQPGFPQRQLLLSRGGRLYHRRARLQGWFQQRRRKSRVSVVYGG
jgi:hypothetical protein